MDNHRELKNRHNCKFQSHYKFKDSNIKGSRHYYEHYHELSNNYDSLIRMNNELYDNNLCYNGGGGLINNSIYTTNQMCNNEYHVDLPPEMIYLEADLPASAGCKKCMFG